MNELFISRADASHARELLEHFLLDNAGKSDLEITFEKGIYDFYNEQAVKDYNSVLCGQTDYDTPWGRDGFAYNREITLSRLTRVRVNGNGATLTAEGLTQVLAIEDCKDVTISGLRINWRRPPFSVGKIIAIHGQALTLQMDAQYPLSGGEVVWAFYDYDPLTKRVCSRYKFRNMPPLKKNEDGTFELDVGKTALGLAAGMTLVLRHIGNYRPVIHALRSDDIRLEDITIFAGAGMGLIAHYCKNITLQGVRVLPYEGRPMSTATDAAHFITCSGLIDIEDCFFEGAGDDAVNVHSFYLKVAEITDDHTLKTAILRHDGTQDQVCDAPLEGEWVEFYHQGEQQAFERALLKKRVVNERTWETILTFETPVGKKIIPGDMLTQASHTAVLKMHGCHVRNERARGVLSQTREALIERNVFENLSGTGIHICCDLLEGWYESISAQNVIIRDNSILRCGYADGTYQNTSGIVVESGEKDDTVGVHRGILIESNRITGVQTVGIAVCNTDGAVVRENVTASCQTDLLLCASDHVTLLNNQFCSQTVRCSLQHEGTTDSI